MVNYKKSRPIDGQENPVVISSDGACIPFDPDNTDYQAYLLWCSEGNVAQPAEES